MNYHTNSEWLINSNESNKLFDIAFRNYHAGLSMGTMDTVEISTLPIPLRDKFRSATSRNYIPTVMRRRADAKLKGEKKFDVKIFRRSDDFRQSEYRYMYMDNNHGKRRLNIIDDGLWSHRASLEDGDISSVEIRDILSFRIDHNIIKENFDEINLIEYVGNTNKNYYNRVIKSESSATQIGRSLSAMYKKPVVYHAAETDVVSRSEAIASLRHSSSNRNNYSAAGMRRVESHEATEFKTFDSRSLLFGAEYMF